MLSVNQNNDNMITLILSILGFIIVLFVVVGVVFVGVFIIKMLFGGLGFMIMYIIKAVAALIFGALFILIVIGLIL